MILALFALKVAEHNQAYYYTEFCVSVAQTEYFNVARNCHLVATTRQYYLNGATYTSANLFVQGATIIIIIICKLIL